MAISDPIADMLTRLRNGKSAQHRYVDIPYSKMNKAIISVLKEQGYLGNFLVNDERHCIRAFLKYQGRRSVIHGLKRVSKPGRRIYVSSKKIPKVFSGLGTAILSTPYGVVADGKAQEQGVGGELLCLVW